MEWREEEPDMKELIADAARAVYLKEEDILKLLPEEIDGDSSSEAEERSAPLVFSSGRYSTRPFLPMWTARDFCATRFGTTKLKTLPVRISFILHKYKF